ncbi:MAG: SOS response-associated peptidase [Ilumatobacteraceae bacterium]
MCGRFVSSSNPDKIAEYFDASFDAEPIPANFNVAPTNDVYGVVALPGTEGEQREVQAFHWGLVPSWAKDMKIGSKMINARGETIAEKPAFKSAFTKHRMIIPMDGFYEWKQGSEGAAVTKKGKLVKQPYFIHSAGGEPLAVAGVWATWRDRSAGPDAPWLHSCAVVTTSANATMAPIHDRMPVMLPQSQWAAWLDPDNGDADALKELLLPAEDDLLVMHPVSTDVNNVRNKDEHLVDEIDPNAPPPADEGQLPLG